MKDDLHDLTLADVLRAHARTRPSRWARCAAGTGSPSKPSTRG